MLSTRTAVTGSRRDSGSTPTAAPLCCPRARDKSVFFLHLALMVTLGFAALSGCRSDFSQFKVKATATDKKEGGVTGPCGDGELDRGETCDPGIEDGELGACPQDCDKSNFCAPEKLEGKAEDCSAKCVPKPVTKAVNGDNCCPPEATPENDSDCADCNNGRIDALETCDDGEGSPKPCEKSPEDCGEPPDACTVFEVVGRNCQYLCLEKPLDVFEDDDGCCPPGGNSNIDNNCTPACGNGVVERNEKCDPMSDMACVTPEDCEDSDGDLCTVEAFEGSADSCTARCVTTQMITEANAEQADGCCPTGVPAEKDVDCVASCTNGVLDGGELCDDGEDSPKPCKDVCKSVDACIRAEFVPGPGEDDYCQVECTFTDVTECVAEDGCCPNGCTAAEDGDCSDACGNGVLEEDKGEKCDPGIASGTEGGCPTEADCTAGDDPCRPVRLSGSAERCSASCEETPIISCINTAQDGCCNTDFCSANSDLDCDPVCGNGEREEGETCDINCDEIDCDDRDPCTVDVRAGDGCQISCMNEPIIENVDGDDCCLDGATFDDDKDCATVCGDGLVQGTELCDDGKGSTQPCPQEPSDCPPRVCTTDVAIVGRNCEARCEYKSDPLCDIPIRLIPPLPL